MDFSRFFLRRQHWDQITPHMYPDSSGRVLRDFLEHIDSNPKECKLSHQTILRISYQYESIIDRIAHTKNASPTLLKILCRRFPHLNTELASYYLIQRGNISAITRLWKELYGETRRWDISKAITLRMLPLSDSESDNLATWCTLEHHGYLNHVSLIDLYAILGFAIDHDDTTLANFVLQYVGFVLPKELIRYAVTKRNLTMISMLKNKWDENHHNQNIVPDLGPEMRELIRTPPHTISIVKYIFNEWCCTNLLDFITEENLIRYSIIHGNADVLKLLLNIDSTREYSKKEMSKYLMTSLEHNGEFTLLIEERRLAFLHWFHSLGLTSHHDNVHKERACYSIFFYTFKARLANQKLSLHWLQWYLNSLVAPESG